MLAVHLRYRLILLLVWISLHYAVGSTYYLASSGNDAKDGLSPATAWKSLERLQLQLPGIKPGDSILLQRGSVFHGSLSLSIAGNSRQWIYIGAYGDGPQPVIEGTVALSNWKQEDLNIWKAQRIAFEAPVAALFIEGEYQRMGRFPDEGYLQGQPLGNSSTVFQDANSHFPPEHWTGAEVVVKSSRWTLDVIPVHSFHDNSFQLALKPSYPLSDRFQYFIQGHLSTLNQTGEWFFNAVNNEVYLYDDLDPNRQQIRVSGFPKGFQFFKTQYVILEGITFSGQQHSGLEILQCHHFQVLHCKVQYAGVVGMEVKNSHAVSLKNNQISHSQNNGVVWENNTNGLLEGNTIVQTGMEPGRGASGNGTYIALQMTGRASQDNVVQYNTIDSTGYSAIDFRTGHTIIRQNYIRNFCLVKDDGGGIYTWENTLGQNQIEQNIIIGSSATNLDNGPDRYSNGIYIDDRSGNIAIRDNTVAYCEGAGIVVHNADKLLISENLLFGNGQPITKKDNAQLIIDWRGMQNMQGQKMPGLKIFHNTFIATAETQRCISWHLPENFSTQQVAQLVSNQYVAPEEKIIRRWPQEQGTLCDAPEEITLFQWQQILKMDSGARFRKIAPPEEMGKPIFKMHEENTWEIWPQGSRLEQDRQREILTVSPGSSENPQVLLYHRGIFLTKGKCYRLTFSIKTKQQGTMEFVPLMQDAPWKALGDYHCFKTSAEEQRVIIYFSPDRGGMARLNFKSSQLFWIQKVKLEEISPSSSTAIVQLFLNPARETAHLSLGNKYVGLDGKGVNSPIVLPPFGRAVLLHASNGMHY